MMQLHCAVHYYLPGLVEFTPQASVQWNHNYFKRTLVNFNVASFLFLDQSMVFDFNFYVFSLFRDTILNNFCIIYAMMAYKYIHI